MNEAIGLIHQLVRERFYEALTLKFEAGQLMIIIFQTFSKTSYCR